MQHSEDHLQGRLAGVLGVGVHRNAPAVVAHAERTVRRQRHLDQLGVAGDRLVHGVVQHLGEEVMQGPLIRAADIHAGAAADGLKPLQHLDVLGGVAGGGDRGVGFGVCADDRMSGDGRHRRVTEQIGKFLRLGHR